MTVYVSKTSWMAVAGSALMMAHHVAARSVRDALFLSSYPVNSLPLMVAAAAAVSLLVVVAASHVLRRHSPARVAPAGFGGSALLYLGLYALLPVYPAAVSVVLYLVVVSTGSLLTSAFWLLLSEQLDPYSLKRQISRIASAGTAGVLAGGILTERLGAAFELASLLPALCLLHALVGLLAWRLSSSGGGAPDRGAPAPMEPPDEVRPLLRTLSRAPYFRSLAVLVLICTASAALLDYAFKAEAVVRFGSGESLLRFFAAFHAAVGLLTFLVQTYLSRHALRLLGAGRTLGCLPLSFTLAGLLALAVPGLGTLVVARGLEATLRGSLFRAGYELFYAPVAIHEKRAARPIIDVGFDRIGDVLGAGGVRLILLAAPHLAGQIILTAVVLLGLAAAWVAFRLHELYLGVLEANLQRRAKEMDLGDYGGSILTSVTLLRVPPELIDVPPGLEAELSSDADGRPGPAAAIADLLSGHIGRVRRVLHAAPKLDPLLVPLVIRTLGNDAVAQDAVRALRTVARDHVGQLADALLDSRADTRIRRRVARVLARCPSRRSARALVEGLEDPDAGVRYQCASALAALAPGNDTITVESGIVFRAIQRELEPSGQTASQPSPAEGTPVGTTGSGTPEGRLGYVFTLLALVLPREPLRIARLALRSDDPHLRGTALEYLESVLPSDVRGLVWRALGEAESAPAPVDRDRDAAYRKLIESRVALDADTGTGAAGGDAPSDGTASQHPARPGASNG